MSDIEVKPVDEVEVVEEVHEQVVEEIPALEVQMTAQIIDEPVEVVPITVIKGSRGHRPKMSPSKKLNVYKKEECPDCKKLLTIGNLRYKFSNIKSYFKYY